MSSAILLVCSIRAAGASRYPMRHPVMAKVFDRLSTTTVRSCMSSTAAMDGAASMPSANTNG